jgi:hypothetical protein
MSSRFSRVLEGAGDDREVLLTEAQYRQLSDCGAITVPFA